MNKFTYQASAIVIFLLFGASSSLHARNQGHIHSKKSRPSARLKKLNVRPKKWAKNSSILPLRLSNQSMSIKVPENNLDLLISYSAYNINTNIRESRLEIGDKAKKMISEATEYLVASVFLFDNMYSSDPDPDYKITEELFEAIEKQKKAYPNLKIALVFDPLHKAYSDRVSPIVKKLIVLGADVYYSDLLKSKASNLLGRGVEPLKEIMRYINVVSFGFLGATVDAITSIPIPGLNKELDNEEISALVLRNAILIKANHKKLLAVKGNLGWEALISSANPHNASGPAANTAISVRGEIAKFIYNSIREDIFHSALLTENRPWNFKKSSGFALYSQKSKNAYATKNSNFVNNYFSKHLPYEPVNRNLHAQGADVVFMTEQKIKEGLLYVLNNVQPGDDVKIQMFYLSDLAIVDAIIKAAKTKKGDGKPIRILLDANKDAFNAIKDGSPNRQMAHTLMNGSQEVSDYLGKFRFLRRRLSKKLVHLSSWKPEECGNCIEVRWFATHGEQNHAKILSIVNKETGKYIITTGSANWTRKNLGDVGVIAKAGPINMESNIFVSGAKGLNSKFEQFFDQVFYNTESGYELSHPYELWNIETSFFQTAGHKHYKKKEKLDLNGMYALAQKKYPNLNKFQALKVLLETKGEQLEENFTPKQQKNYILRWVKGELSGLVGW